ncbi:UDP-N-acetylmuramoyl-L-alanyl-D-glutamate--2,6-diaminopimelate ligase [Clostridia bacterium]|nr:UDP-N-acetylmuramoyl-L-alanyl-D-glutamate--2,6-diaminopimelate ligase [Clostridia bacterium]
MGITADSRKVKPGDIFVAVKGLTVDGHDFIEQAKSNGAVDVISANDIPLHEIAAQYYGYPAERLVMLGVTGTKGKTTVTHIVHEVLLKLGYEAGLIGTNRVRIYLDDYPAERTTPDALELNKILSKMVDEGITHCVMEVSSHALELKRVAGIEFKVGAFTNLSRDHLDYHGDMESYFAAKAKLFEQSDSAVICGEGDYAERIKRDVKIPITSLKAANIGLFTDRVEFDVAGLRAVWHTPGGFSVENALTALGILQAMGEPLERTVKLLGDVPPVKGRMESVEFSNDFTVLIDYAHSPDSLENALETVRGFAQGRVITVFGCGGDRDRGKRPIMGEVATRLSDITIITSDNPRTENPETIIDDIAAGCAGRFQRIADRRAAIKHALEIARAGDVVLLAGKGQETYQEVNGVKHPMDERVIIAELRGARNG